MASVEISGLEALDAACRVRAALMKAATVAVVALEVKTVKEEAVRVAPEDEGELKAGIGAKASGTSGEVRASARHSAFQEFGTSRNAAQPYMGPAADASRKRFAGRVALAVRKAVT